MSVTLSLFSRPLLRVSMDDDKRVLSSQSQRFSGNSTVRQLRRLNSSRGRIGNKLGIDGFYST